MRRKTKLKRWVLPTILLLAVLAAVAVFFALFYVSNEDVEVLGNTRYKDSEIRQMAMPGLLDHNSLYLRWIKKTIVTEEVPFVDSIDIEGISRNQIRLHVNEDYPIGFLLQDGYHYYFDAVGLVIESLDAEEEPEASHNPSLTDGEGEFRPALTDVCQITGLTEDRVNVGETIHTEDDHIFQTLLVVNKLISKFEILPDAIEVGEGQSLTLHYGKAAVALGSDENLEEKMSRAAAILPQLKGLAGVLHLERYNEETINIIFEQEQSEETSEEKETVSVLDLVGEGTDLPPADEEVVEENTWAIEGVTEEETWSDEEGAQETVWVEEDNEVLEP